MRGQLRGNLYARECLSYVLCGCRGIGSDAMERGMMLRDELMGMGKAESAEVG